MTSGHTTTMTKQQLLHALRRIGLNDEIVFAKTAGEYLEEYQPRHAFVVTGDKGLVLVLSETDSVAGEYPDSENAL